MTQLRELGMPQATFEVSLRREDGGRWGKDQAEFLVSFNRGEELKPIQKIASCGELSRAMLAVKVILASADQTPTLIFDEVDVGIGGGMAEVVGKKLCLVSRERQVLCITHLPQIAAFADAHFQVFKRPVGGRMRVAVRRLHEGERVEEMARMLGGKRSALPLQYAEEILGRAQAWKRSLRGSLAYKLV
jgi:DNA repair protein RecN (Recombination protein N)